MFKKPLFVLFLVMFSIVLASENENDVTPRGIDANGMLTSLASSIMSRGYGVTGTGSQVVSLNLTNLLVLVLLKALIFAAGSLGAGTWKGGYGRSEDGEEKLLTEEELLMYLSYMTGAPGQNGCLQNISCRQPNQANRYVVAGDMLLKASRMLQDTERNGANVYDYTLQEVKEAVNYGLAGGDCNLRYKCGSQGHNN